MANRSWQVLHVLSNYEKKVVQHLDVRSVEHYLPLYTERIRWTDRTVLAERPLFSGYVFARFTSANKVSVVTIPGVLRLLGGEERNLVRDEELAKIREGLSNGLRLRPHDGIATGTKVRIQNGPFAGVEGVVTELRNQCRVIITLSMTHQRFTLDVGIDEITILSKPTMRTVLNSVQICGF